MIYYPNAKVNIGLNIHTKREDGYHLLQSYFYPVPLFDILEIVESDSEHNDVEFSYSGIEIDGSLDNNLCVQAYRLLAKHYSLPPVKIHLHKQIPIGAGLGGGSADASFTLKGLNKQFNLGINDETLEKYAEQLGADCPFFISNTPKFVSGIGEELEECNLNLKNQWMLMVFPDIHVSTKEAYSGLVLSHQKEIKNKTLKDLKENPELFNNDFEKSIFSSYPALENIKQQLQDLGAYYTSMSGSGSTIFGLFEKEPSDISFQSFKIFQL